MTARFRLCVFLVAQAGLVLAALLQKWGLVELLLTEGLLLVLVAVMPAVIGMVLREWAIDETVGAIDLFQREQACNGLSLLLMRELLYQEQNAMRVLDGIESGSVPPECVNTFTADVPVLKMRARRKLRMLCGVSISMFVVALLAISILIPLSRKW